MNNSNVNLHNFYSKFVNYAQINMGHFYVKLCKFYNFFYYI